MQEVYNDQIGIPLNEFIEQNIKLAHHVAKRYYNKIGNTSDEYEDITQLALVGLVKAYKNYDNKKFNTKFSTYAVPLMHGEIQRHLRDQSMIKFPRIFKRVWRSVAKLDLEEEPNEVIAEKIGVELRFVERAMEWYGRDRALSINKKVFDDSHSEDSAFTLGDTLKTFEDYSSVIVNEFMETLDGRTRSVLELAMNEGLTQREIGEIVGISQVHVSRLLKRVRPLWEQYAS
ncbi:sigma-70 family RNA polymerase sigma factor [Bacillus sonorensis]|uniref:sigma-70 family RNA polymerase sigma factor n=1 Tax=Bacillus sonorensis TaxID=119858 RepID=UPI002DBFF5CB|nr:sigma-70 family RNA polymerase sigma factor [Bacillus sonorensis]MEC1440593.1 sigma-70 family RNA polymerase sigma factor [Bacillus sonorensis]